VRDALCANARPILRIGAAGGQVSLNDLYKGKVSKLALSKQVLCEACSGVGGKKGSAKYVSAA